MESKKEITKLIYKILSEITGTEVEDIQPEYSLTEDLHMGPAELSDFMEMMEEKGLDIGSIDFDDIETVDDIVESLALV